MYILSLQSNFGLILKLFCIDWVPKNLSRVNLGFKGKLRLKMQFDPYVQNSICSHKLAKLTI